MVLFTLRVADEVLAAEFPAATGELDAEMIELATAIIERRSGTFDPSTFRDPYKEALQRLAEAKLKGKPIAPQPTPAPSPVVADLMAVLQRSLGEEAVAPVGRPKQKPAPDRRERNLLLPVEGKGGKKAARAIAEPVPRRRRSG